MPDDRTREPRDDALARLRMDIRTLVPPALQERTAAAVAEAAALWRASLEVPPVAKPTVLHAIDVPTLYEDYPYDRSLCTLVVDIDTYSAAKALADQALRKQRLSQLVASWQCGVLLFTPKHVPRVRRVLHTPLGARCSAVARPDVGLPGSFTTAVASVLFSRWLHVSFTVPPYLAEDPVLGAALPRLHPRHRAVLVQLFSDPGPWTVKTMAAASAGERRTLERAYAAVGLPSPARVLRWAQEVAGQVKE